MNIRKWFSTTVVLLLFIAATFGFEIDEVIPCRVIKPGRQRNSERKGRPRNIFIKPNVCCGLKPFNSKTHICCLGKVLSKESYKCCLDGSFVPIESICLCHPASMWVVKQIEKLTSMEAQLGNLAINCLEIIGNLHQTIVRLQEDVEFMDRRAQDLYQKLIKLIGGKDIVDPLEVEHIVKLVLFLNENEESIQSAKKSVSYLTRMDSHQPQRLKLRSLRHAIQWSRKLKVLITQEIQVSLEDQKDIKKTQDIVMEREHILKMVSLKNIVLTRYNDHLNNAKTVLAIIDSDIKLTIHLQSLLDGVLTLVTQMEQTFQEENKVISAKVTAQQDAAFTPDHIGLPNLKELELWLNRTMKLGQMLKAEQVPTMEVYLGQSCNFTSWDGFLQRIETRIPMVMKDVEELKNLNQDSPKISIRVRDGFFKQLLDSKQSSKSNDSGSSTSD